MEELSFGKAFRYPFNQWQRLFNILWGAIPVIGWFAVYGYTVKLVQEWVHGDFDALPEFRFGENLSRGFFMFLKTIPLWAVAIGLSVALMAAGDIGVVVYAVVAVLMLPMLTMNLYVKETVRASFDITVVKPVFSAFFDYITVLVKSLGLAVVFFFLSMILVGIPASYFTQHIFMADFYRRHVGAPE